LGWNPGTKQELFSLDDFVTQFSVEKLNKKAAIFDRKKLDYLNGLYIRQKSDEQLLPYFKKFLPEASDDQIKILIPVLKERLVKFSDLPEVTKFLLEDINYDKELLLKKGTSPELATEILNKIINLISTLKTFDFSTINTNFLNLIKDNNWNTGEFFMIFRVAICGSAFTPPVVDCLPALGKEGTLRKLNLALEKLK